MIAEFDREAGNVAQILRASQQHQLGFSCVNFEAVGLEPKVDGSQHCFHLPDHALHVRFFARDQNLCVIGVLCYHCVLGEQGQVVREDVIEQRAEFRVLKNADVVGKWGRLFNVTKIVCEADALCVI